jgi:hypothetical protein
MNLEPSFMNSWMPVQAEAGALQEADSNAEMRGRQPLSGRVGDRVSSFLARIYLLGVSTTESTPLLVIIFRLLLTRPPWLGKWRKGWLTRKRVPQGKVSLPEGIRNRLVWRERRPGTGCRNRSFRRVWVPPRVGSSFESKRLMRMTHPKRM